MFSSKNITTPIGEMLAIRTEKGLCLLEFLDGKTTEKQLKELGDIDEIIEAEDDILLNNLEQELKLYFEGNLKEFKTPIDFIGTDFQKKFGKNWLKFLSEKHDHTKHSQLQLAIF